MKIKNPKLILLFIFLLSVKFIYGNTNNSISKKKKPIKNHIIKKFLSAQSIIKPNNKIRFYATIKNRDESLQPKEFLLSAYNPPFAWYGPPFNDSVFIYYKNANFDNMLWVRDDEELMKKVRKYKFKYLISIRDLFIENDSNGVDFLRGVKEWENGDETYNVTPEDITEKMLERVDRIIEKYKDDPNLIGYWICDEPFPSAYKNIAKVVKRIKENDPNHYSLINIGDNEYTTDRNIEKFIDTTEVKVLCYDRYNFFNGYDINDQYFERLAMMRRHALKHNIPFYNIIQAVGTNGTSAEDLDWRTPNRAEHRWLVYSSLAYGVHGIIWFHWDHEWGVTGNPDRKIIYPSIQSINAETKTLRDIMFRLTTTNVYHIDKNLYYGGESSNRLIKEISNNANLVVGLFKDKAGNENYFMLMNKDYSEPIEAEMEIKYTLSFLKVFNVKTNKWENIPFEKDSSGTKFTVRLRKGGGKLFKFKRKKISPIVR